jgi:glycosyltransferase involved in cell wall biosynthesis
MQESCQTSQLSRPRIIVTIPAYDEGQFISEVVLRARKLVDEVTVVDDGSLDETSEIARAAGASVANHQVRKGYGQAIRSCFEAAKAKEADIVVTLDGDNQHNPEQIPALLGPVLRGEADLVIGSRFLQPTPETNMPGYRRFGIRVITWLFNIGSKVKVSDAQSGFRAYSRRILDAISVTEKGMGVSVEVLIKAQRNGFRIKEVPISCRYHSRSSTINPVKHGLGVALTIAKLRLRRWER